MSLHTRANLLPTFRKELSLLLAVLLLVPLAVYATTTTYDFTSDTAGQTPGNATVTAGTVVVTNQATLGNSIRATAGNGQNNAGATLDNFASSSNYSITWKEAYESTGGRHGFILRTQSADATTATYGTGIKQGYLFQVNHPGGGSANNVKILVMKGSGTATQILSQALTGATPRWFKAIVSGESQGFYYSDNGTTFTQLGATTTDSTYGAGGVQYVAGFGTAVGNDYADDIVQQTFGPVISSISLTAISTTSATIIWTTDTAASSQVDYGSTTSYTASTTLDATLTTSHSVTVTGLTAGATYHFRVRSTDSAGVLAISGDQTLTQPIFPITITTPKSYQVIQRDSDDSADIAISGTYAGTPIAIEASWNGQPYTTVVSSPSGNVFSGTLTNQTAGQGTLLVRFTNDTSVSTSTPYVGIGDIFVIAGQSNASGRGTNNQSYSHATLKATLFGNNDSWSEMTDPTDSSTGQVDAVSTDSTATGSVWPLIATHFLADQSVPVAFIPTAKGGSSITEWQRNGSNPGDTTTLYGSMHRRITAVGGSVKGILFYQGETDAGSAMSQSNYLSYLSNFSNGAYADFGIKVVVGQIANQDGQTASRIDNVRLAQIDSWDTGTTTLAGPALPDVSVSDEGGDSVHLMSNSDLQVFADRWWAALQKDYYGGPDGRGPRFVSAEENSDRTAVTIIFSDDTSPIVLNGGTGLVIKDNGTQVGLVSTSTVGTNAISIGLQNALAGTATVSFGSGNTISGLSVPTDSSTYNLPVEIFIDEAVSVASAPTVSLVSPSGVLPAGTTNTILSVTTNENAACKYGTIANAAFASIPNTFSTTGTTTPATNHSTTISGLSNGNSYTYYVRCADFVGNVSTDLAVSISVTASPSSGGGHRGRASLITVSLDAPVTSSPATSTASTTPILKATTPLYSWNLALGDIGSHVTALQRFLIANGYPIPAGATGYFGPQTQSALASFRAGQGSSAPFIAERQGDPAVTPAQDTFPRNLSLHDTGNDVRKLQQFLNANGFAVAETGPGSSGNETGYFGLATYSALARYQNAYANDVLTPVGIRTGSGYFGPSTRSFVERQIFERSADPEVAPTQ